MQWIQSCNNWKLTHCKRFDVKVVLHFQVRPISNEATLQHQRLTTDLLKVLQVGHILQPVKRNKSFLDEDNYHEREHQCAERTKSPNCFLCLRQIATQ